MQTLDSFIGKIVHLLSCTSDNTFTFNEDTKVSLSYYGECETATLVKIYISDNRRRSGCPIFVKTKTENEVTVIDRFTDFTLDECEVIYRLLKFQYDKKERDIVTTTLKAYKADYESIDTIDGNLAISIYWGDWKHDHHYLDRVMNSIGYIKVDETPVESDGSDTYSSVHHFKFVGICTDMR